MPVHRRFRVAVITVNAHTHISSAPKCTQMSFPVDFVLSNNKHSETNGFEMGACGCGGLDVTTSFRCGQKHSATHRFDTDEAFRFGLICHTFIYCHNKKTHYFFLPFCRPFALFRRRNSWQFVAIRFTLNSHWKMNNECTAAAVAGER